MVLVRTRIKRCLRSFLHRFGYDVVRCTRRGYPVDLDAEHIDIIERVRPFTMTSHERLDALLHAVRHLEANNVPGDIVECGVWRGGSMMAAARMLLALGSRARRIHLFDVFESLMPVPAGVDETWDGRRFLETRGADPKRYWRFVTQAEVEANLVATGYPRDKLVFVAGRVEETLPVHAPASIALLRLDTDWYESTRSELANLYPRLACGGVLIIDDYGSHKGARLAVDEWLATLTPRPFLSRIDDFGRLVVKPD